MGSDGEWQVGDLARCIISGSWLKSCQGPPKGAVNKVIAIYSIDEVKPAGLVDLIIPHECFLESERWAPDATYGCRNFVKVKPPKNEAQFIAKKTVDA